MSEGDRLRHEWLADSTGKAIANYNNAVALLRKAHSADEARALLKMGESEESVGHLENALSDYQQAFAIFKATRDPSGQSNALTRMGRVFFTFSKCHEALSVCKTALALSRAGHDIAGQARAIDGIAEAKYGVGDFQASIRYHQQALEMWRRNGDESGQAWSLLDLGYAYSDLGQVSDASQSYNEALTLSRKINDRRLEGVILSAIGHLDSRTGENQLAIEVLDQAKQIIHSIGDSVEEGRIINGMAYVNFVLGDKEQALKKLGEALNLYKTTNYVQGEADTYNSIGQTRYSMGNYPEALDAFKNAIEICKLVGDRRTEAFGLKGAGSVYAAMGDKAKALECYNKVLPLYQIQKDLRGAADTWSLIGHLNDGIRDNIASRYYTRAIKLSRIADYPLGEASALYDISRLEQRSNHLADALEKIEEAISIIETLRTKAPSEDLRTSFSGSVHRFYELKIDLLMSLHQQDPSAGLDARALEARESAGGRSLLDILAAARGAQQKPQPGASNPEHSRFDQLQPLHLAEIQKQVDDDALLMEYSLGEAKSFLWTVTNSGFKSFELPARVEIEEKAKRLRDVFNEWAEVEAHGPQPAKAGPATTDLNTLESEYKDEATRLSDMLLGPAAAELGNKRLIIVPDGVLQYIPFQALPIPGRGSDFVPMVAEHEITNEVSASALAILHNQPSRLSPESMTLMTLIAFADPVFGKDDSRFGPKAQPGGSEAQGQEGADHDLYTALRSAGALGPDSTIHRLAFSRREVEQIMLAVPNGAGTMVIGFDANKAAASSPLLSGYRIIHIATHGKVDSENPELSGLVLSRYDSSGRPRDGFLGLDDIYNLHLSADLVVLSACDTGLGKPVAGEGLIGLTRGFMYAGASRVVASLWKVDDNATAELMKRFYSRMLQGGERPSEALREAQIEMWKEPRWRSPFFWAAFVIQGEYDGTIDPGRRRRAAWQPASAGVVFLLLLSAPCYALIRRRRKTGRELK